jgi:hypothetical protein
MPGYGVGRGGVDRPMTENDDPTEGRSVSACDRGRTTGLAVRTATGHTLGPPCHTIGPGAGGIRAVVSVPRRSIRVPAGPRLHTAEP